MYMFRRCNENGYYAELNGYPFLYPSFYESFLVGILACRHCFGESLENFFDFPRSIPILDLALETQALALPHDTTF